MDTITTTQDLLKCNGSAQAVTVALMPNEIRLIAAAPCLLAALNEFYLCHWGTLEQRMELRQRTSLEWERETRDLLKSVGAA